MILVGVFINTFLPLVLSCFSLPVKGHLSESTLMQFRNERGRATWSLHGWNPIHSWALYYPLKGMPSPGGCCGRWPVQDGRAGTACPDQSFFHTDGETEAKSKEEFSPKGKQLGVRRGAQKIQYPNRAHLDFHCAVILVARSLHAWVTRAILEPTVRTSPGSLHGVQRDWELEAASCMPYWLILTVSSHCLL